MTNAAETFTKLQEDYRRMLKEHGIVAEAADPTLSAFFRSVAHRIDAVSSHARQILPGEVLDQLIGALGIPQWSSRPAQTVVRFVPPKDSDLFEKSTGLVAQSTSGERLIFSTDMELIASQARLAFAVSYREGTLVPLSCRPFSPAIEDRFLREAVPASLGQMPFLILAFDIQEDLHLDRHGLFFELAPETEFFLRALQQEIWCFLDESGKTRPDLMMRSGSSNGGMRLLQWIVPDEGTDEREPNRLGEGFYGGRAFRFPSIPPGRRVSTRCPRSLEQPLHRMFGSAMSECFDTPKAWIKIVLPRTSGAVQDAIIRLWTNAVTASNVESFKETPRLSQSGTVIPVSRRGGMEQHFVSAIAIVGEHGTSYVPAGAPASEENAGRYRYSRGQIELTPGRSSSGAIDEYANVSLLVSDGARANAVPPNGIRSCSTRNVRPGTRIENPVQGAGGTDNVPYPDMFRYFADMIRSRERLVTRLDIERFVETLDRRIGAITITPVLHRTPGAGVKRVYRVTLALERAEFIDSETEGMLLSRTVEQELKGRGPLDLEFRAEVEWL